MIKREVDIVFFKKKKKEPERLVEETSLVYQYLLEVYEDGEIQNGAFVIPEYQVYIYADILGSDETMAQVVFQIHHETLEDPIIDPVCGLGMTYEECIQDACDNFNRHDLALFICALEKDKTQTIIIKTMENHAFDVYTSKISFHGKREGIMPESFWDMLGDQILKRLGNKRCYWIKIYCAKMGKKSDIEVRINDVLSKELSSQLKDYVKNWDCIDAYHTEKQSFIFYQKEDTYTPPVYAKEQIVEYTKKAIQMYEKCADKEDYKKLRVQLIKLCKDESLGMELFGFIPELYCKHVFSDLECGEQLFLIRKGEATVELYQSQVRSFSYIDETIRKYLKNEEPSQALIEQIAQFSANYRAIQKALDDGDDIKELYTPGIGYFVKENYILR